MEQENRLDRQYNGLSLFWYTVPSICNLLFMSLYQMVDGVFISNFVGEHALAAINMVYPFLSIVVALMLMLSTGGSAIVARKLGSGRQQEAREDFTTLVMIMLLIGLGLMAVGLLWMEQLLTFMGVTPLLWDYCQEYLGILVWFMPASAIQIGLLSFFVTAGKPGWGFVLTVLSGITNVVLDYVFIVQLGLGIQGAALGTALGYVVAAVPGLLYFLLQRRGTIFFVLPVVRPHMLAFACFNGSSEMISNLSIAVTTFLFNKLALHYMGEGGVAAVTIVLYAQFFLTAVFLGYISGAAPVISFHRGKGDSRQLSSLFRYTIGTVLLLTVLTMAASWLLAKLIVAVYIRPDSPSFPVALHGFLLFAISYLFAGINIYVSGLFTALENGKVSAILSALRTFVFLVAALLLLPLWLGSDGIWLAVPLAEGLAALLSVAFLVLYRKQYFFTFRH